MTAFTFAQKYAAHLIMADEDGVERRSIVTLDGDAYDLHGSGTGDMIVRPAQTRAGTDAVACESQEEQPMPALKPCPFCGSDRITVWNVQEGQQTICKDCKAMCAPQADWAAAVDVWNTRADLAQVVRASRAAPVQTPMRSTRLPRSDGDGGWTLPLELLQELAREVAADGWDHPTAEVVQIIALSVERRLLEAATLDTGHN